jgi:Family of unknown function (DUF6544)
VARALDPVAESLLAAWTAWALPGGEEAARRIRAVEWNEDGELRSSPRARWIPFTARHRIESSRTTFRWDAVLATGALLRTAVTDACEDRHGWSMAKAAGVLPVARAEGPEIDRGQVQRYLADLGRCPAALLLHPTIQAASAGGRWLRLRDSAAPADAEVELEIDPGGGAVAMRAVRPAMEGRRFVARTWSGRMSAPVEWEGMRVTSDLEAAWHYPEGVVVTYRAASRPFRAER